MKRFSEEEDELIRIWVEQGYTHEQIGLELNRTKSSIMHRVQRLGISKDVRTWDHLSKEDCIELIQTHLASDVFSSKDSGLPSHKILMRILGCSSWSEARALAGVPIGKTARWKEDKPTVFYIIELIDTCGTIFRKYGLTQRSLSRRYAGLSGYAVILEKTTTLAQALRLENLFSKITRKYTPKTELLRKDKHGGYTECYTVGVI